MDNSLIRLECIRIAGGNIAKAAKLYAFVTVKPTKKAK
jgi:hypothetical protein